MKRKLFQPCCLFVLRFYGPVNPMGSCRARSVYLTTRLLGRLSPLSGFANSADPDETTHNEPSHPDLNCLPLRFSFLNDTHL